MPTVVTVLESVDTKSGNNANGPWTLNIFSAKNGMKFQTFETPLASEAVGLFGQAVEIAYEEKPTNRNGKVYMNNVISAISPSNETPQAAPAGSVDNRQEVINRSAALSRAIDIFGLAGADPMENLVEVQELAVGLASFIETGSVFQPEPTA